MKRRNLIFIGAGSIISGCSGDADPFVNGNIRADIIEQILSNEAFISFRREVNNRIIRGSYIHPFVIISARVAGINYPMGPRVNQPEYLGSEIIEDKFEITAQRAFVDFLNGVTNFATVRTPGLRSPRYVARANLGDFPITSASTMEDRRRLWFIQVTININFDSQQNSADRTLTEVTTQIRLNQALTRNYFNFDFPILFWDLRNPKSGNDFVLSFLASLAAVIIEDQ